MFRFGKVRIAIRTMDVMDVHPLFWFKTPTLLELLHVSPDALARHHF